MFFEKFWNGLLISGLCVAMIIAVLTVLAVVGVGSMWLVSLGLTSIGLGENISIAIGAVIGFILAMAVCYAASSIEKRA